MWEIEEGGCIRHIPRVDEFCDSIYQMKQYIGGEVAVGFWGGVSVWGDANNWDNIPIREFSDVCKGCSLEFLDGDLLLRGDKGQLGFILYREIGSLLYSAIIPRLHSNFIYVMQRIAKNIVVTVSADRYLKVLHPISRKCYLKFNNGESLYALAYLY